MLVIHHNSNCKQVLAFTTSFLVASSERKQGKTILLTPIEKSRQICKDLNGGRFELLVQDETHAEGIIPRQTVDIVRDNPLVAKHAKKNWKKALREKYSLELKSGFTFKQCDRMEHQIIKIW